jgi:titin
MISVDNELIAYDIADSTVPSQLSNYSLAVAGSSDAGVGIGVQGTVAFVAHESNGLMAVDISNAISPQLMSQLDVGGVPVNLSIQGQKAYVARADGSVSICDISVPSKMSVLDVRVLNGKSDLLVNDTGSVLIGVGEPANASVYVVDATTSWTRVGAQPTGTSHTLTGLEKGVQQYFRVAAVNNIGQGTWSENSAIFTPEGVPDAPTNFMASLNQTDGSVDLAWDIPGYDGGDSIQSYSVRYSRVGGQTIEEQVSGGGTVSKNLVTLERGEVYTFEVKAINSYGGTEWSDEVSLTSPNVPAGIPSVISVTPGLDSAVIQWTPVVPAVGNLPITEYVIQSSTDDGDNWTTVVDADGIPSDTTATIAGLDRNLGPYKFQVAAKNVLAVPTPVLDTELNYSNESTPVTPLALATAVDSLNGSVGASGEILLEWAEPTNNGGSIITDYLVEYSDTTVAIPSWTESPFDFASGFDSSSELWSASVSGLTNGIDYNFRVTPVTAVGHGASSDVGPISPIGVPLSPLMTAQAGPGDGQVTINWTPDPNNGGSAVTGFKVEYKRTTDPASSWNSVDVNDPAATNHVISGLDVDIEYQFRVRAINSAGLGDESNVVAVTPFGIPEAPTNLLFAPDQLDGSLQLSWTAPTNDGGNLDVNYQVQYRLDGETLFTDFVADPVSSDLTADISGLTRGGTYNFQVRAANSRGESNWLTGQRTVPDVPAAISGLSASTTGNDVGEVTLSWTTPSVAAGELPITGYQIEQSLDNLLWTSVAEVPVDNGFGVTTLTVTGLLRTDGTHTFRVAAKNILSENPGTTHNYATSDPVLPLALPGAVRMLQGTPGDTQVGLTWDTPLDTGGEGVTDYIVEYQVDSGAWTAWNDGVGTFPSTTVTGLTNGGAYVFRVKAKTRLGEGVAEITNSITPAGVPNAPTNITVTQLTGAQAGSIGLGWDASLGNGSDIVDYHVQYAESSNGPWTTFNDGLTDSTGAVVTGVPTGVDLYFRVAAENSTGMSSYSNSFGPEKALGSPAAPTGLLATANANGSISLNWNAPTNNGGSTITDYVVEYRKISEQDWNVYEDDFTSLSNTVVTTLVRDDGPFEFRVKASNSIGTGPASAVSVNVTPLAAPSAVQNLIVIAFNEQIAVTWSAPSDNGGTTVTDYIIEYKTTTDTSWTTVNDGTSTTTSETITGLTNGGDYQVRIRAVNSVGAGDEALSNTVSPVTNPGVPAALNVEVDSGQALLTWTAPDGGGRAISDYIIEYRLEASNTWTTWNDGVSTATSETITGLTNGESYLFRVAAKTSFGTGDYEIIGPVVIGPKAPAPHYVGIAPHSNGVIVGWGRVIAPEGYQVVGHRIDIYDSENGWRTAKEVSANHSSDTILNLDAGVTYTVRVAALTSIGIGNFAISDPVTL